jgi:peptide-methionine (S)-S-oxide reductase
VPGRRNRLQVCTGNTQQVEVYDLTFEGDESTYENLVKHFYSFHDPTTLNQQGNDRGTQYASAIFCHDEAQVHTFQTSQSGPIHSPVYQLSAR